MEMRLWKLCTAFLCCVVLSRAHEKNSITFLPEMPVVEFGGHLVLNCSSSCTVEDLGTALNYDHKEEGPTWKAFTVTINQWAPPTAECSVKCAGTGVKTLQRDIIVYQVPRHVEMVPVPKMEVGSQYNLTCQVFSVAPIRNLTVTLWKGSEQLLAKTFENHAKPEPGDVVVTHLITAQQTDHQQKVTCQTSLDLGPRFRHTSGSITLEVFEPLEHMMMELQKSSPRQSWDYELICTFARVRPCHNLTVTFLKGSKWINSPTFSNCTSHEVETYRFTLPVTLHPEDHGNEAYCHVVMDLSQSKQAYQATSPKLLLRTSETYLAVIVAATAASLLLALILVILLILIFRGL